MADLKISEMTDGGIVQTVDEIPVNRSGENFKITVGSAATADIGNDVGDIIAWGDLSGNPVYPAGDGRLITNIPASAVGITGAITTVIDEDLDPSLVVVSDFDGKIEVSAVTSTELGYLSGATSPIQTQINTKVGSSVTITAGTGLTGGGNLTANRTISLNSASIASLAKADTALQPSDGVVVQSRTVTNPPIVSGTTTAFADGTPLATEGMQYMTYSFTPKRADSFIRVRSISYLSAGAVNQNVESAVFVGSTFLARSGMVNVAALNTIYYSLCQGEVASGSTAARSISVRVANNTSTSTVVYAGRRQNNALPETPGFLLIEEVVY